MNKLNYYLKIYIIFVIILITSCSLFKKDKENIEQGNTNFFFETVAKPDPSLKGIKVRLPKPSINKTWMQSTNNQAHFVEHPLVKNKIKFEWKFRVGKGEHKGNPISSQPVIDEKYIYTIDTEAKISVINKKNGKKKWDRKFKKKIKEHGILNGGLSVNQEIIAVTTGQGNIFVLDKNNGKILWEKDLSVPIRAAPIISGNIALFLTKDNRLYAHDLSNGDLIWSHQGLEEVSTFMGSSTPVVSQGIVITTYSSGEVYALNLVNGDVIWNTNLSFYIQKKSLQNISDIRGNPVVKDNIVYVVSYNGKMVAMDLNTGKRIWESNIGGIQTPWVVSGFIFVLSKDNELICLTSDTGKIVWVSKLKENFGLDEKDDIITWTGPLLAGRMLIVSGSHGIVAAISPYSGKFLGAINVKSSINTQAIVADETVYFITSDGYLLAYR